MENELIPTKPSATPKGITDGKTLRLRPSRQLLGICD